MVPFECFTMICHLVIITNALCLTTIILLYLAKLMTSAKLSARLLEREMV